MASLLVLGFSLIGGLAISTTPALADTACALGTYSTTGNTPCTAAPPGTFVSTTGATSPTPCPAGTYQPNSGQEFCEVAPPGTYVNTTGQASPTPCAAGFYQSASGQASCIAAPIGSYVDKTGATAPTACPAGMTTPATGSMSASDCRFPVPSTADECKNGGWQHYADANGTPFKNQGDCVSYVATKGKNPGNG